jgi:cytochrome c-type biogenesis protein CcmF
MTAVAYAIRPEFNKAEDEQLSSREFWLFIGSLVLLLSAIQVTWTTSIPVYNILVAPFGDGIKRAPPIDAIRHYNSWQILFAIIVCSLVAVGQFLRYKSTDMARFRRELLWSFVGATVITALGVWAFGYQLWEARLVALLFTSTFCALANATYLWKVLKGALAKSGPSVAHVGFALVLLGALVSTSRQKRMEWFISRRCATSWAAT